MPETVIIGLGNTLLADDGVGIKVAGILEARYAGSGVADVVLLYAGGIRLLDAMAGYKRAIIIDAMVTGNYKPGTVLRLSPSDLVQTNNSVSVHDIDLPTALEMGRMLGVKVPPEIVIWAVEASDVQTFTENLSPEVEAAVPEVVAAVEAHL